MGNKSDSDASCYNVRDSILDDLELNWKNLTIDDCNCSNPLHSYLNVCGSICEPPRSASPNLREIAIPGVLCLAVFLIGTIGNALVILVVNRFKTMRTVTNIFLAALSTADLCLIWICVPIMVSSFLFEDKQVMIEEAEWSS